MPHTSIQKLCERMTPEARELMAVWCAATEQWVSPADQAAALLASLPEETARQVLDFARFLSLRVSGSSAVKAG